MNKRVAASRGDQTFTTIPDSRPQRKHRNRDTEDLRLAAAITSKIEAGNMRAAIRLLCSDDKPAAATAKTLEELEKKHPEAPVDRRSPCDPTGNTRFAAMQVEADEVLKILKTAQPARLGD